MPIITRARRIHASDPAAWAWSALRKFQNVELVSKKIATLHNVDPKWMKNVRKQARQIRHCMIQAREYFAAAQAVSLATKPNLLYYGTMSLALAEILMKQSGESSLDRARAEHRHHGLLMTAGDFPPDADLQTSAGMLRAAPMIVEGRRKGTFQLWHRTSREHPLAGQVETNLVTGGKTSTFEVVLGAINEDFPPIPDQGVTLADALAALPLMVEHVLETGLKPHFVRGRCSRDDWHGDQPRSNVHVTFHPSPQNAALFEGLRLHPSAVNRIEASEIGLGLHLVLQNDSVERVGIPLPPAAMVSANEWRMWTNAPRLNEFGYLYVALFIAGNYARYYPDRWLADVEGSTPLAIAIEQLCTLADWRAPWLSLCEFEGILFVNDL